VRFQTGGGLRCVRVGARTQSANAVMNSEGVCGSIIRDTPVSSNMFAMS